MVVYTICGVRLRSNWLTPKRLQPTALWLMSVCTLLYLQVVGVPWPTAVWCTDLSFGTLRPDTQLKRHSNWVRDFTPYLKRCSNWTNQILSRLLCLLKLCNARTCRWAESWLKRYDFCLSFRVCLLGVLTLIISWGSLGLELAVAAVSVTMATLPSSLALQWCKPFSCCLSECVQRGCYCSMMRCVYFPSLTVSQRLLRFPGYLRHQGNQGKRCHQPRFAN